MPRPELEHTDRLRGARISGSDVRDLEIRDCLVDGLQILDSIGAEISVSGDFTRVLVEGVDVTDHVRAVLDERLPVRRLAREARMPEEFRLAWDSVQAEWETVIARVRSSPGDLAYVQVKGEWSIVQTLRHLRFAADAWLGTAVLAERMPHHRWGLPPGGTPAEIVTALGLDLTAEPRLDEVLGMRAERRATIEAFLDRLGDEELDRVCAGTPGPGYPVQEYVVRRCLRTLLTEEVEHLRYALRDLAELERARG